MSVTLKLSLLLINEVYHMMELYKIQLLQKKKNDESSAVCWSFSEKSQWKLNQNRKKYNNL